MKTLIIAIAMLVAAANLSAGEPLDTLWSHKTNNNKLQGSKFVHNDTKLLVVSNGFFIEFDPLTGDTLRISKQFGEIYNFDCADNPSKIVFKNIYGHIIILNYFTFEPIDTIKTTDSGPIVLSNDEKYLIHLYMIDENNYGFIVKDVNTLDSIKVISTNLKFNKKAELKYLKFSSGGRFLAVELIDYENDIAILRFYDGNTFQHIKDIGGNFSFVDFSQDGNLCIATNSGYNKIRIFNTENWTTVFELNNVMYPGHSYAYGIISNDNKKFLNYVSRGDNYFTQIWEIQNKTLKYEIENLGILPNSLSINNEYFFGYHSFTGKAFMIYTYPRLLNIDSEIPDYMNLFYNNGFYLSSTQEIISPPSIEVFNINGGIVLPLSLMIPLGGVYKINTLIPHGLYFVKLHINGQIYNTNTIVE